MCIDIKYITTRSRLISPIYSERLLVPVKCGHCCECEAERKSEWQFRIFHEWQSTIENHGFVLFMRLSYADKFLPHISDFMDLGNCPDYPCFSREHIRKFLVRLRRKLSYRGYNVSRSLKYYLCAEYGSDKEYLSDAGYIRKATNRPHYHILFFSTVPNMSVEVLYQAISDSWQFGKIDNLRKYGYHCNYWRDDDMRARLQVSHYVSLYVQKNCDFRQEITKRINSVMLAKSIERESQVTKCKTSEYIDSVTPDSNYFRAYHPRRVIEFELKPYSSKWLSSLEAKQYRAKLVRCVDQFHLQSQGFGVSALRDLDLSQLWQSGLIGMPDIGQGVRNLPLPKYYERKLFEEQLKFENGVRVWQSNSLGKLWKKRKQSISMDCLTRRYTNLFAQYDYHPCDPIDLARYVVYKKGRIKNAISYDPTFEEKLKTPITLYNYATALDRHLYHEQIVTSQFLGIASTLGNWYHVNLKPQYAISIFRYIRDNVEYNQQYEAILDHLDALQHKSGVEKQLAFEKTQRLKNLYV